MNYMREKSDFCQTPVVKYGCVARAVGFWLCFAKKFLQTAKNGCVRTFGGVQASIFAFISNSRLL